LPKKEKEKKNLFEVGLKSKAPHCKKFEGKILERAV
jgi:hypothetical protein